MNARIIIPTDKSTSLIDYVKKHSDHKDKIHILQDKYLNNKINEIVNKSVTNCIIIFNPFFVNFEKNYIQEIKEKFKENPEKFILVNKNENSINENSIIAFNKKYFKSFSKKIFNTLNLQRKLVTMFNWNINFIQLNENLHEKKQLTVKETQKSKEKLNKTSKHRQKIEKNKKIPKKSSKKSIKNVINSNDFKNKKPKILFISDVKGWAWWIKAEYLKKYLKDYYDIDIIHVIGKDKQTIDPKKHDLYFTFGYSYVNKIMNVAFQRRISGITAHRPWAALKKQMNKVYTTHANSIFLFNELKQYHKNAFYVPNGVEEKLFYEKTPIMHNRDNLIFGHVGKNGKMKNQEKIIEPAVKKSNVKYFSHYNDYTNKIPHNQMINVHHNYDVLLIASSEDGTPNSFLEASLCGRMTIGNKIGNLPELITHMENGILLDNWDIDNYVDAIKWCKKNPEKVYEMGQKAKKETEKYWTWKDQSKNYKYMFDKILGIKRDWSEYENKSFTHIN